MRRHVAPHNIESGCMNDLTGIALSREQSTHMLFQFLFLNDYNLCWTFRIASVLFFASSLMLLIR